MFEWSVQILRAIFAGLKGSFNFEQSLIERLACGDEADREIFSLVLSQQGFDPVKAKVRLNWGSPETPEVLMADLIAAATLPLIRPEEFRKNAAKSGWELWGQEQLGQPANASSNGSGSAGGE